MAKRVAPEEKPFNPVKEALTRSVLKPDFERSTDEGAAEGGLPSPVPEPPKLVNLTATRKPREGNERKEIKKLTQVRRFLLTDEEDTVLDQLVRDMGRRLGTHLTLSHLLRATATLLLQSREDLLKQSEKMGGLKRPANNDPVAIVSFEHNITRLIDRAIRNSRVQD